MLEPHMRCLLFIKQCLSDLTNFTVTVQNHKNALKYNCDHMAKFEIQKVVIDRRILKHVKR